MHIATSQSTDARTIIINQSFMVRSKSHTKKPDDPVAPEDELGPEEASSSELLPLLDPIEPPPPSPPPPLCQSISFSCSHVQSYSGWSGLHLSRSLPCRGQPLQSHVENPLFATLPQHWLQCDSQFVNVRIAAPAFDPALEGATHPAEVGLFRSVSPTTAAPLARFSNRNPSIVTPSDAPSESVVVRPSFCHSVSIIVISA